MAMGRPTILTPELQEKILKYVREGNFIETACAACGVNKQSLFNWKRWADEARIKLEANPDYEGNDVKFYEFIVAVEEAEALAEAEIVQDWRRHTKGDWRAGKELLERRAAKRWGNRQQIDITLLQEQINAVAEELQLTEDERIEFEADMRRWKPKL